MTAYKVTLYYCGRKHFVTCSARNEREAKQAARDTFLGRVRIVKVEAI